MSSTQADSAHDKTQHTLWLVARWVIVCPSVCAHLRSREARARVQADPIVLTHARAVLVTTPEGTTSYLQADLRDLGMILRESARTLAPQDQIAWTGTHPRASQPVRWCPHSYGPMAQRAAAGALGV